MSVHEERQPDGTIVFQVRWRQGGRNRSRRFNPNKLGGKRAAERAARAWDAKVATAAALDGLDELDRGKKLFEVYADEWYEGYAQHRLSGATLDNYVIQLDRLLIPQWGAWSLRSITPREIEAWMNGLAARGVGDPTILKALSVLQGILKRAVVDGELATNPVAVVAKPRQRRSREPVQIPPATVERIRRALIKRGRLGDAVLVGLLAYAGPRPESEAVTLTWPQIRRRTMRVIATKKHGVERDVRLEQALVDDLAQWRRHVAEITGATPATGLVFPFADGGVSATGHAWKAHDWDNWREDVFRPAALAAGAPADATRKIKRRGKTKIVETTSWRPRDLRSSFATLLIYGGRTPVEVAEQMGNSGQTVLKDYAGVWAEYDPDDRVEPDEAIRRARDAAAVLEDQADEEATG